MFGKQIIALETRKEGLLLESELNRLRLRAELNNLREAADFSKHLSRFASWKSVLPPLAGLAGALSMGGSIFARGFLQKALVAAPALIRLGRTFSALLAKFR